MDNNHDTLEIDLELLSRALEHAPFSCAIADLSQSNHPLVYVNDSFEELTGYNREDILGKNCRFLQCEDTDPEKVHQICEAIENRETLVIDILNERKNGSRFWNRLHLSPVVDTEENKTYYISSQENISQFRKNEKDLEKKESLFNKLQEIGNLGIWEYDTQKESLWYSRGIADIYGIAEDRDLDLDQAMEFVVDSDRDELRKALETAIETGEHYERQIQIKRSSGEIRHIRALGEPLSDGKQIQLIRGVLVDNTDRVQMRHQVEGHNEFLRELNLICSDPNLPFDEKLNRILELGCERFNLEQGLVTKIDDDMQTVEHSAGPDPFFQPESSFPLSESYCQFTLDNQDGLALEDTTEETFYLEDAGVRTYFGNNVEFDEDVYGTVCFISEEPRTKSFNKREKLERQIIVQWIRSILERKSVRSRIEKRARTDDLTELPNRRSFLEALSKELKRFDRSGRVFSIIMLDLDYFKQINDEYGHAVGDKVLEKVADLLAERSRESDTVARFGGEEFIMLLPDTYRDEAKNLAEDLREQMKSLQFKEDISLTASFGVIDCDREFQSRDDLLKQVDDALYSAKGAGRDRVKLA